MLHRRTAALALALAVIFSAAPAAADARQQPDRRDAGRAGQARNSAPSLSPDIAYAVSMPEPNTHLLQVRLSVRGARGANLPAQLDLVMPVWTPGSYLVREYARHVQDFAAQDADRRPLAWRKSNKNTWRVETAGAREAVVTYAVYSNELTVRTNELTDRRAFWNNAATLMYVDGHLGAPATVRVAPHRDWKIATGLPAVLGERNTFRAENFDTLYDSPFLVADFKTTTFDVRGVPHRFVIDGEGNYDQERIARDAQKIAETTARHAWNVKRIRPDALGPFDYTGENYTRLLWVAEGVTNYYEDLLVRRAGLMTDRDYLARVAAAIRTLQNTPGRLEMSIEEASFDAWIKYYRPDENTINSSVSYYDKGGIVAMLLDLEIRRRSAGAKSLDDVMRHLYAEFGKRDRNFTPEDFQRGAELAAGSSLEDFFRRYVRGREELDYNAAFGAAGLQLLTAAGEAGAQPAAPRPHFGATVRQEGDRLVVTNVPAGTPAYNFGLYAADQIVAVDGYRVATLDAFNARLLEHRPNEEAWLTVFRGDELRTLAVRLGARPEENYRIVPVKNPSPEQTRVYESWLASPFPK
ncbi:MAG: PDZ domain-containing protein [Acidobacteria bacterium]|nr:PDZ domain-containing protein [Acidobacteriota bacterium]